MKTIYVITMWSGGKPARKWQSEVEPEVMEHGTGVRFIARDSRLSVRIIGPISIEEYESGKEAIESGYTGNPLDFGEDRPRT